MKLSVALVLVFCLGLSGSIDVQALGQDEAVTLHTKNGDLKGSLRVASGGHGMVALIIAGSGPTDRNGNQQSVQNNSLKMIADSLEAHGISSLRYDKRGIGESASAMTSEDDLRFDTYINDAMDWAQLLKKDKRFHSVAILGHSEGSLIGMIAAQRAGVKTYVSIAGIGYPASEALKRQLKEGAPSVSGLCDTLIDSLAQGHLVSAPQQLYMIFRPSVQPYLISWFHYDPLVEIAKLDARVLIVQGSNDLQVTVDDANMLSKGKPTATLAIIPGMNHILKMVSGMKVDNLSSYNDPSLPLAPEFVSVLVKFLQK